MGLRKAFINQKEFPDKITCKLLAEGRRSNMAANDLIEDPICQAAQAAFSIDMIVECILEYLKNNFEDVKAFRLISPVCNMTSLSYFSAHSKICNHRLLLLEDAVGIGAAFESLSHCIASSQEFPCNSLEVGGFWRFDAPGVAVFLKLHGEHMKHLILSQTFSPMDISCFQMLLFDWLPSLQTLKINSWNFENTPFRNVHHFVPKHKTLPNLEVLSFNHSNHQLRYLSELELTIFQDIILSSPNLQSLDVSDAFLKIIFASEKIHLIRTLKVYWKNISYEAGYYNRASNLAVLEKQTSNLKEIEFCFSHVRPNQNIPRSSGEMISSMFDKSKDSLETVTMTGQLASCGIAFFLRQNPPVLSSVTEINLTDLYLFKWPIPRGSHISSYLPALQTVIINDRTFCQTNGRHDLTVGEKFVKFSQVISSVKKLEIHTRCMTVPLMTKLSVAFPEVETIKIHCSSGATRRVTTPGSKTMWLLPKNVKEIQVWEFPLESYKNLKLESLLTGIPQDVCEGLKESSQDLVKFEDLKAFPSIRELENLVSLTFFCKDFPFKVPQDGGGYFSNLTKWFILEPMESLQLQLAFPQVISTRSGAICPAAAELPVFSPIDDRLIVSYFDVK
ncbi:unnamed protein product [Allacma fusca]|uniref:Uncharacterized protein n=1 Tax=Allacma fusca TaxID=39272 RepID=A0A8J2LZ39_9HEXA|nr:unnamed protein product [Allacma fusca]